MESAVTEKANYVDVATLRARVDFLTSEFSSLATKYANVRNELERLSCQSSDSASNFSKNLLHFVASLFDNQQYSDVEFKTKTNPIKAHRFILKAREAQWSETADSKFIDISHVPEDVARTFVKWLYTGDCERATEASDDFLLQLLSLAKSFHLPLLTDWIETLIKPRICKENFVKVFGSAYESNAKNLTDRCLAFAKDIYPAFSASDLAPLSAACLLPLIRKYSSPFHEAARLNRIDVLNLLLTSWNIISSLSVTESVNEFDAKGETPLSLALSLGHFDVASALLEADASLSVVLHSGQHSLLQAALLSSNTAAALYLLEHKCQVEAVNPDTQDSPLHLLCRGFCSSAPSDHQRKLVEQLLRAGANTQILDPSGQSGLHLCILHQNEVAFQVLLTNSQHCDVNLLNREGISPLWLALVAQFVPKPLSDEAVQSLSKLGFAVDLLGEKSKEFAKQLVTAGANVDLEMITTVSEMPPPYCWPAPGDTALLAAARHGLEAAVLFLLDLPNIRTDVCSRSTVGESPLHLVVESGLADAACGLARLRACPNTLRISVSSPQPRCSSASVGQPAADEVPLTKPQTRSPLLDRLPTRTAKQTVNPFGDSSDSEEQEEPQEAEAAALAAEEEEKVTARLDMILDRRERGKADGDSKESLTGGVHTPAEERLSRRETPLHLAARLSMHKLLYLYIKEGGLNGVKCPDWFIVNESGDTVFGLALTNYDPGLAEDLLSAALTQLARTKADHNEAPAPRDVFDKMTSEMIKIRPAAYGLLQRTIESGSLEGVSFLLKHSIDVNPHLPLLSPPTRTPVACTLTTKSFARDVLHLPLWIALAAHRNDMASILVEHGADVDSWSELSSTGISLSLLHRAILCGLDDAASFLIESGCDCLSPLRISRPTQILANDKYRFLENRPTPLHLAASVGLTGLLSILLTIPKIDVNAKDDLGRTPLHMSVENDRLHAMEVLLNDSRIDLRARDNRGFTAFRVAVDNQHLTAARSLQQKDPSLSLECDNSGRNVLHSSVAAVNRQAIFFLIQIGVDMNVLVNDLEALSPLHIGITAGIPEDILRSMILAGASVSAVTKQKQTGLHLAVLHNQPTLLRCLLENGAPPNAQDTESNTALHLAMRLSNLLCAEFLLSIPETDATLTNFCGQQPLHVLANHPHTEEGVRDCFFDRRPDIDVNAVDAAGNTPLMLAFAAKNIDFCIYLLAKGASLGNVNFDNWSIFAGGVTSPDFRQLKQILGCLLEEPAWSDSPFCVECLVPFGFKRRKHHCRHCGRVLCSTCSEYEVPIVKYGLNKPVRVCKTCYHFINNPSVDF